jgi:hypothetical protein
MLNKHSDKKPTVYYKYIGGPQDGHIEKLGEISCIAESMLLLDGSGVYKNTGIPDQSVPSQLIYPFRFYPDKLDPNEWMKGNTNYTKEVVQKISDGSGAERWQTTKFVKNHKFAVEVTEPISSDRRPNES